MTVKIWNKKNNELLIMMEWTKGRLDSRRYNMIVNQLFMLACDGSEYENLVATFDNTPQRIETETFHGQLEYSSIFMALYVNGEFVKTMTISD